MFIKMMPFDTHDMKPMEYVVFGVVRFDTHDIKFKYHCMTDVLIKNASFDTHDLKPIHYVCKLLYYVFDLSTLATFFCL